jgi:hypothetical protein
MRIPAEFYAARLLSKMALSPGTMLLKMTVFVSRRTETKPWIDDNNMRPPFTVQPVRPY